MRVAAIDIGTVTCRLLIAEVKDETLIELTRHCEITNLGIGVDKTGVLQADAIKRVVTQIARYQEIIAQYNSPENPIKTVAIATSAARDASNSSELVEGLREIGVELSVIPGQQEASLSFKGASCNYANEDLLVLDIGGGSTEVVFGRALEEPKLFHSFDIGCRRVTERFLHNDPPLPSQLEAAQEWIIETMDPWFKNAFAKGFTVDRIVAVAGTATTSVSVHKHMEVYDSAQVDKTVMAIEDLQAVYEKFCSVPLEQRKEIVGLEPKRASVIIAGMLILLTILSLTDKSNYTVSESDILQGIVMTNQDS
ncbi:MAG: Ppx/GppA family phosphatase [Anaerotardibacter sp.]